MSFDLVVFDPRSAPREAREFMAWYDEQAQLEDSQYNDVSRTTPELRQWYCEMATFYPPMNGPEPPEDVDNPKLTDYAIGVFAVCACFAWSQAQEAYETMFRLAQKHGVGFYNVSSAEAEPWFPPPGT